MMLIPSARPPLTFIGSLYIHHHSAKRHPNRDIWPRGRLCVNRNLFLTPCKEKRWTIVSGKSHIACGLWNMSRIHDQQKLHFDTGFELLWGGELHSVWQISMSVALLIFLCRKELGRRIIAFDEWGHLMSFSLSDLINLKNAVSAHQQTKSVFVLHTY